MLRNAEAFIGIWGLQKAPNTAPLTIAAVLRRNQLDANSHIEVLGGTNADAPGVADVIVENNKIKNSADGFIVDKGVSGLIR